MLWPIVYYNINKFGMKVHVVIPNNIAKIEIPTSLTKSIIFHFQIKKCAFLWGKYKQYVQTFTTLIFTQNRSYSIEKILFENNFQSFYLLSST